MVCGIVRTLPSVVYYNVAMGFVMTLHPAPSTLNPQRGVDVHAVAFLLDVADIQDHDTCVVDDAHANVCNIQRFFPTCVV